MHFEILDIYWLIKMELYSPVHCYDIFNDLFTKLGSCKHAIRLSLLITERDDSVFSDLDFFRAEKLNSTSRRSWNGGYIL
jgi:hypothetical protein